MKGRHLRFCIVSLFLVSVLSILSLHGVIVTYAVATVATVPSSHQSTSSENGSTHNAIAADKLPEVTTIYFPQTGHHLSNRAGFLDFWRSNGQKLVFGFPITEEIVEDGRVVQYFERARFEHYPDMAGTEWEIRLGLLGTNVTGGPGEGIDDPMDGSRYFSETRHTLSGEFLRYWERHGGEKIFGFPLSEPYEEHGRTVQYFERAHFAYHPEDMDSYYRAHEWYGMNLNTLYEVRLSDLGRQVAEERGIDTSPIDQLVGAPAWTPALWKRRIEVNLTAQWLTAYEEDVEVYRAPVTTGRPGFYTPTGTFGIYHKLPMQTMRGSVPGETWNVPNIPWVMYVVGGVAMHGTYWHTMFGSGALMSHGCINLGMDDAHWIYQWSDIGTEVHIHY